MNRAAARARPFNRSMKTKNDVSPARPEQEPLLRSLLAAAFFRDPVWLTLLPDEDERARLLPLFFAHMLRIGFCYGSLSVAGDPPAGLALWLPPGREVVSFARDIRAGGLSLLARVRPRILLRAMAMQSAINRAHGELMRGPHWVLALLAVDPAAQGRGVGRGLLRSGLDRCDRSGLPAYLETQNERNGPFYERAGFRLLDRRPLVGSRGYFTYFMRREKFENPPPIR
jgi:GNAT superfamily N-acetyltransferase